MVIIYFQVSSIFYSWMNFQTAIASLNACTILCVNTRILSKIFYSEIIHVQFKFYKTIILVKLKWKVHLQISMPSPLHVPGRVKYQFWSCVIGPTGFMCSNSAKRKRLVTTCEPRPDKNNKTSVRPAKTQISLGIRPVWSESSLCTQWVAKDPSFLHGDSEDSDQTGRMPRLIWVFAGHTVTLLVLSCRGSCDLIVVYL